MGLSRTSEDQIIRVQVPPITVASLADQEQTTFSAGLLPLNSAFGQATGSKYQLHEAAVAVNAQDGAGNHLPTALPYKPSLKGEVIKRSKKVREILLESQANYQVLKHCSKAFDSICKGPASGSAVGMSTTRGDFKQIFLSGSSLAEKHMSRHGRSFSIHLNNSLPTIEIKRPGNLRLITMMACRSYSPLWVALICRKTSSLDDSSAAH